jgi:hypothetical protein
VEAIAPLLLAQAQAAEDLGRQLEVSECVCVCVWRERREGVDEVGGSERERGSDS